MSGVRFTGGMGGVRLGGGGDQLVGPPPNGRIRRFVRAAEKFVDARMRLTEASRKLTTGDLARIEREYPQWRGLIIVGTAGVRVAG